MRRIGMVRGAAALGLAVLVAAGSGPALAADVFTGTFTINGQTVVAGTTSAESFSELFTNTGLRSLVSSYTDTSAATVQASLRGIPATLSYEANSTTLRLQVPGARIDRSFTGATRDESQDLALKWLRGEGAGDLTNLLRFAVASTAIDPVAGNPNSLMSSMGAADFAATTGIGTRGVGPGGAGGGRVDAGARFGSYSAGGYDTSVYTLPLRYSYTMESGMELLVDTPITLMSTNSAQSYSGSLGVGLRVPVPLERDGVRWSLTPMARSGAVGSMELGAVGAIWSVSLTSTLGLRLNEQTSLTIGNMVGYMQTLPIQVQDYNLSYDLKNTIYRNGAVLTRQIGEAWGRRLDLSGFVVDTRFSGDALFVQSYQEYGAFLTFGEPVQVIAGRSIPVQLGVTYLNGERGYRGFTANIGISF